MAIENVELALQINQAILKQNRLLAKGTKELKDQLSIMHGIESSRKGADYAKALDQVRLMRKGLEELEEQAEETGDELVSAFTKAAKEAEKGRGSFKELGSGLKKSVIDMFPTLAGAAAGAFSGLQKGFSIVTTAATAAWTAVTQLGLGIVSLGKSIIAIPFKILGGLVDMANNLPNDAAFARAREAIRKDFGKFSEDISKNIRKTYKTMHGELAQTSLSVFRIMGTRAERLEYIHELVKGMGPLWHIVGDEVSKNSEAIIAYQKGLGISHEQMKGIGALALRQGRTLTDVLNEITVASTGMADAFDISHKVISRDMAEMTNDVANFGSMTVQEMSKAAVYVRKLGLEIKDVIGTIEKYDNFEDAAMGAAHLAQAFGANVDALEMMREQDPTKRVDMLRKSMAAAGIDAEKLTRQELKLLAQHTGLSEEAAKAAFSLKNQGVSMADLEKQQGRNEKKTMTQQEAMIKLSDSIERMVKTGQRTGGFFTQFFKGFERGVKRFSPFRTLLRDIRRDLRIVFRLGIKTGKAFIKFFPGVMDMVKGMRQFFAPWRFRKLRKDLKEVFDLLFKDKISLEKGLQGIKDIFWDFFTGKTGGAAFKRIYEGAIKFGKIIMGWLGEGLKIAMRQLTKAFDFIAEFIENPKAVIDRIKAGFASSSSPLVRMFEPLWTAIANNWEPMWKAFKNLMTTAWEKIKPWAIKYGKKALYATIAVMFAPAVIGAALGALTGGVLKVVGKWILGWFGKGGAEAAAKAGSAKFLRSKAITGFGARAGAALRVAGPIGLAVGAALGISEGLDLFMDKIEGPFDETTKKMAAAGTGIIHGLTLGLLPDNVEVWIVNAFAKVSDMIFKALEGTMGAKFVENLKEYLEPLIDFWGALGDTLVALVTGDHEKFNKAFDAMFIALGSAAINGAKFMILEAVPRIIEAALRALAMIGPALGRAVRMLWDKVSGLFANMVQAVFGDTAGDAVRWVLDLVGEVYTILQNFMFGTLPSLAAEIPKLFRNVGNKLVDAITGKDSDAGEKLAKSVTEQIESASPKVEATINATTSRWVEKLTGFAGQFKGIWEKLKAEATFQEEAEKMKTGGLSFDDMSLYQKIKDLDPAEIKMNIKKFRDEVVPQFIGKDGLLDQIRLLGDAVQATDELAIGKVSLLSNVVGKVADLGESSNKIANMAKNFNPLLVQVGMLGIATSVHAMSSGMAMVATAITDEELIGVQAAQARIKGVTQVIEEMVQQVNSINTELRNVKTEKVQVKLKNLARSLGVKNKRFTIKNDKIKIFLKLNVNMDSESVAYALHKGSWFQMKQGGPLPKRT